MRIEPKVVIVWNGRQSFAFTDLKSAEAFIADPWGQGWKLLNEHIPFTHIYGGAAYALDVMQEGCTGDIDDDINFDEDCT
tara:strand:- start:513 stop:752 length:240 start_codon:yes stop_codon:yes gene_type:complete